MRRLEEWIAVVGRVDPATDEARLELQGLLAKHLRHDLADVPLEDFERRDRDWFDL
jgi:hypothetical protein